MKQFENYFKNRKEVEDYFKNEVFKFSFMGGSMMCFDSLKPVFIDDELFSFKLDFYYENGNDFFDYSSFSDWLDGFQLSSVTCISEETHESQVMFFSQYVEEKNNK